MGGLDGRADIVAAIERRHGNRLRYRAVAVASGSPLSTISRHGFFIGRSGTGQTAQRERPGAGSCGDSATGGGRFLWDRSGFGPIDCSEFRHAVFSELGLLLTGL